MLVVLMMMMVMVVMMMVMMVMVMMMMMMMMMMMVVMMILFMTAACPNVTGSYRICKPTGRCIFPAQICDSVQDCSDDTDEVNCS